MDEQDKALWHQYWDQYAEKLLRTPPGEKLLLLIGAIESAPAPEPEIPEDFVATLDDGPWEVDLMFKIPPDQR